MNSTEVLREIERRIVKILVAHGSNAINATNSLPDLTALISEHYTEKSKYDELLRQRDELRDRLDEAIATIKAIKAANDAAIKNTER